MGTLSTNHQGVSLGLVDVRVNLFAHLETFLWSIGLGGVRSGEKWREYTGRCIGSRDCGEEDTGGAATS
jgi:hypothetical protein